MAGPARQAAGALAACTLAACAGDPPRATTDWLVAVHDGDVQTGAAGSVLDGPLAVRVTDREGRAVRGATVRFRVAAGRAAELIEVAAVSDEHGIAGVRLRLGEAGDTALVDAVPDGQREPVARFVAVAGGGPTLMAVEPAMAGPGDTLRLRGTGLGRRSPLVLLGAREARVVAMAGDTLLRAVVPPCVAAGTVPLVVHLGAAATAARSVTVRDETRALALGAFDGARVAGSDLAAGCLRLPGDGARWLVVPHFAGVGDSLPVPRSTVVAVDTALPAAAGRMAAGAASLAGPAATPPGAGAAHDGLEARLRAEERALAPRLAGYRAARASSRPSGPVGAPAWSRLPTGADHGATAGPPPPPELESVRNFRVLSRLDGGRFDVVAARLRAAGSHVLLYEDRATPAALDPGTVARMLALLDGVLHPLATRAFGTESDVDGNGRVIVLLTPVVNALVPASRCASDGFVPGFFYAPDLDARATGSNGGEVFYALAPDPSGARGCPHDIAEVERLIPPTFVHELQHMISFHERVMVRRGPPEATWLNEGLSHVAEELAARRWDAATPAGQGRSTPGQLLPDTAALFLRANLERAALFLATPSAASALVLQGDGTLPERGAAWLFVRWLGAQHGPDVWRRLVQSSRASRRNVETATGEPFAALFGDWALALVADSLPEVPRARVPARYRFGTERTLRELLTRGLDRPPGAWPLAPRQLPAPGSAATLPLRAGGLEPFLLTTTRGAPTTLRFAPPTGTFPASLDAQVSVLRLDP